MATALIGGGVRFTGQNSLTLPANPATAWPEGGALTLSAWVKPATLGPNAIIFSRRENINAFLLGLDAGVPFVSITSGAGTQRTPAAAPLTVGTWNHLAVTVLNGVTTLYLNGEPYGTLPVGLPPLAGTSTIGKDDPQCSNVAGFAG